MPSVNVSIAQKGEGMFRRFLVLGVVAAGLFDVFADAADGPVARWKLAGDARNAVPAGPHGDPRDVAFQQGTSPKPSARFDGRGSRVTIPIADSLRLGTDDFTISLWVHTDADLDDDLGDLVSQFDVKTRRGFHLSLRNNAGVTHSQANYRQLQFGIDAGTEPVFTDEGRPGNAVYGQTMAVHDGALYVGTCEPGGDQAGHVYRYDGPGQWTDCGTPDKANSITGMAAWNGSLYVGSGKYRLGGSALSESENPNLGGRVFRYLGDRKWEEVGHFPEMEAVGGMVVYRGKLYVGSLYKPAMFARYEGDRRWTPLPVPNGKRVEALGVFNGYLWATGYDEGHVYRFDGDDWVDLGRVGEEENTQTYAFAAYRGLLHVATWRTGKVFAWDHDAWHDRGRLGDELEVMGMLVHNGCLYGGTLPLGQIYRYDGGQTWTLLKQLDTTPDVKYRRVWTMAEYRGKLFATTLPSAHVWSMQTGACVSWDKEFPAGWHHVAAQRQGDALRLFVDGKPVAEEKSQNAGSLKLTSDEPWQIGAGSGDFFNGSLADVQVFRRALSAEEIRNLAAWR
jgi:hypothetical protein